jgi:CRP-like cAMP-binding protein
MIQILGLYHQISSLEQAEFESKVETFRLKKGEYLLMDGDVQEKMYMIKKGIAMTFLEIKDKRQVIDFSYANKFCADINSFSNQTQANYCIECATDIEIEAISYVDLMLMFEKYSNIERAYRILLEKILAAVLKKKLELSTLTIKERFHTLIASQPELFSLVSHKLIASYLNIDPTNFSKLYNDCQGKIFYK